jgi:alpha-tubulin suppressor-like RCC1 family protein
MLAACGTGEERLDEDPTAAVTSPRPTASADTPDEQPSPGGSQASPAGVPPAPAGARLNVDDRPFDTGSDGLDALLKALEAHDVDALVDALETSMYACGVAPGSPVCPTGVVTGSQVSTFPAIGCGAKPATTRESVRAGIVEALASTARSSVYSVELVQPYVGRAPSTANIDMRAKASIVLTAGETPSPLGPASTWTATQEGALVGAQLPCGSRLPATWYAEIAAGYGDADWIVAPRATCTPADVSVTAEIWQNHDNYREMFGNEIGADGDPTGAVSVIRLIPEEYLPQEPARTPPVRAATWSGGLTKRGDVFPGMRIAVDGWLLDNCMVEAWSVSLVSLQPTPTADASTPPPGAPAPVLANNTLAAGNLHTCAIRNGRAFCWGRALSGALGTGFGGADVHTPISVAGLSGGVTAISAGNSHNCAIKDGGAWCWGVDDYVLSTSADGKPVLLAGFESGVTSITAGNLHTCAVRNGGAWCWGDNTYGQLGNGTQNPSSAPVAVASMSSGVTAISGGMFFTCAIQNGGVWCWGANFAARSTADPQYNTTPVALPGLESGVSAISVGATHGCAIRYGAVLCWGARIGGGPDGNLVRYPTAVAGLESGVSAISAGSGFNCAIQRGATLCWGLNYFGQLGDGTTADRAAPTPVVSLGSGVTAITAGGNHACATKDGALWCWGGNLHGMLGNGTAIDSTMPVAVQ